jgi:hypothetical protein
VRPPRCPPDHTVLHDVGQFTHGSHNAPARNARGQAALHRARDHPAGCWLATGVADLGIRWPAPHYPRLDYAPGPVGFALFVLLIVILAFAGVVLLFGVAVVGIAATGVLIVGGIVSSVLRGQFRRK